MYFLSATLILSSLLIILMCIDSRLHNISISLMRMAEEPRTQPQNRPRAQPQTQPKKKPQLPTSRMGVELPIESVSKYIDGRRL